MIECAITAFVQTLNASWTAVHALEIAAKQEGLTADWAQANWEALVEASIPFALQQVRLVVYGDGADCHSGSSRFSFPNDMPTHQIRCQPADDLVIDHLSSELIKETEDGYALDRFVSLNNNWYFERPPFDHALIEHDGHEYVVALNRLKWELVEVSSTALSTESATPAM